MGKFFDWIMTGGNWEETQRISLYKKLGKKFDADQLNKIEQTKEPEQPKKNVYGDAFSNIFIAMDQSRQKAKQEEWITTNRTSSDLTEKERERYFIYKTERSELSSKGNVRILIGLGVIIPILSFIIGVNIQSGIFALVGSFLGIFLIFLGISKATKIKAEALKRAAKKIPYVKEMPKNKSSKKTTPVNRQKKKKS